MEIPAKIVFCGAPFICRCDISLTLQGAGHRIWSKREFTPTCSRQEGDTLHPRAKGAVFPTRLPSRINSLALKASLRCDFLTTYLHGGVEMKTMRSILWALVAVM